LPNLPNLLRYETVAVADYGCMSHALHLRQIRQSLNLGFTKGIEADGAPDRVNLPFLFDVFRGKFGLDLDMTGV